MLARSQSAPLDFTLYSSQLEKEVSTGRLATILHQIERIRTLKFHNMPPNFLDTIHDILTSLDGNWKASSLQSLAIGTITSSRGPCPASIRVVTDVIRPTHLLRRLNLSSGYYSWGMFPIPSLTHLCLRGQPLGGVSGTQFIDALHHMQNLESLKMNWEGTNIRQFPPMPCPQPIHLPALRILEIWSGNEDDLKSLLSMVVHPRLHQLAVNPSRHPASSVPTCFKSVLSSIGEANFGLLEYLSILEQMTTISKLPWVYDPSHNNAASSGIFLHIEEEDDQPFERGTPFEFVVNVMSCLTVLNCSDRILLRHIHLDSSDAPIDDFTRLFAPLLHLETIKICRSLAQVLFKALDITPTSAVAASKSPIPFPKLQTVVWNGPWHYTATAPIFSSTVLNDLHICLLSHRVHGVPISRLELQDCERLDIAQVHQLKEMAVDVIVWWGWADVDSITD